MVVSFDIYIRVGLTPIDCDSPHCHESIPVPAERLLNAAICLTFKLPDPPTFESSASAGSRSGTPLAIEPAVSDDPDPLAPKKEQPHPPDGSLHQLRHARALTPMMTEWTKTYFKEDGESLQLKLLLHVS